MVDQVHEAKTKRSVVMASIKCKPHVFKSNGLWFAMASERWAPCTDPCQQMVCRKLDDMAFDFIGYLDRIKFGAYEETHTTGGDDRAFDML